MILVSWATQTPQQNNLMTKPWPSEPGKADTHPVDPDRQTKHDESDQSRPMESDSAKSGISVRPLKLCKIRPSPRNTVRQTHTLGQWTLNCRHSMLMDHMDSLVPLNHDKPMESEGEFETSQHWWNYKMANTEYTQTILYFFSSKM
jgi:hypothetical protein